MIDVLQDLSTLTTIGKYNLDSLSGLAINIFSHGIEESIRDKEPIAMFDIGIGTISISNEDNELCYKFIPSKKLEEQVINTYRDRKSALVMQVDKALGDRITNTYKDLF